MTRTAVRGFLAVIALAALPLTAFAQSSVVTAIGPRVGFSIDPDQFVVGGHLAVGPIAPSLMFAPSLELGFGDNRTVVSGNFDLQYHFRTGSRWHPYLGAGMGVNNETVGRRSGSDRTASEVGGNVMFGAMAPTNSGTQ